MLTDIFKKIDEKGWNLYAVKDDENALTLDSKPAALDIESGKQYLIVPRVVGGDNYCPSTAIRYSLHNKAFPIIKYAGNDLSIALLRVYEGSVVVRSEKDTSLTLSDFYSALDTLPVALQPN